MQSWLFLYTRNTQNKVHFFPVSSSQPITAALPLQSLIIRPLLHFLGHAQTVTPDNPIQRRTSQAEVTGALGGKE